MTCIIVIETYDIIVVQREISNLRKDIQVLQDKVDRNDRHTVDRNVEQEKVYTHK